MSAVKRPPRIYRPDPVPDPLRTPPRRLYTAATLCVCGHPKREHGWTLACTKDGCECRGFQLPPMAPS